MATLATVGIGRRGIEIDLQHTAVAYSWALSEFPMKKILRAIQALTKESEYPLTAAAVAKWISANDLTADEKKKKFEFYAE